MTNAPDVNKIIQVVQLQDVRVVDVAANTTIRTPSEAGKADLFVDWAASSKSRVGNELIVEAVLQARIGHREARSAPAVRIRTVFELSYTLPEELVASEDELNVFAKLNGTFNAWPYARALIQSLSASMNLPPITLPVFRIADLARSITRPEQRQLTGKAKKAKARRKKRS